VGGKGDLGKRSGDKGSKEKSRGKEKSEEDYKRGREIKDEKSRD
jgi:hypothetical protein